MPILETTNRKNETADRVVVVDHLDSKPFLVRRRSARFSRKPVSGLVLTTLLAVLCFGAAVFYTLSWNIATLMPQSIEYEGHVLSACVQAAAGKNFYDPAGLVRAPWSVIIYNPLFFLLGGVLLNLTYVSLVPLRVISMLSLVASCFGVHVLLRRLRVSDFHSLTAAACFATFLPTIYWSCLARVDMLGLAFGIWGVERFIKFWRRAIDQQSIKALVPSIVLLLLSFFTKQSGFYLAFAVALYAFCENERRLAARFALAYMIPLVVIGAAINVATSGGYLAHLTYAVGLPWEWGTFSQSISSVLFDPKTAVGAMVIACGLSLKRADRFERFALIIFAVTLVTTLYTVGVRAAYHNHLLPVLLGFVCLIAINLRKLPRAASACLLVFAICGLSGAINFLADTQCRIAHALPSLDFVDDLKESGLAGKLMLTEDPGMAIFSGATPAIVDATTIFNMSQHDRAKIDAIVASIERRDYVLIALNKADCDLIAERIWPERVVHAIRRNYKRLKVQVDGNGNPQCIYVSDKLKLNKREQSDRNDQHR